MTPQEIHSPLSLTIKGHDGKYRSVPLCEYIKALSEGYLGLFVLGLPGKPVSQGCLHQVMQVTCGESDHVGPERFNACKNRSPSDGLDVCSLPFSVQGKPDSVIKHEKFEDLMNRYHGQIDNAVYAMEQVCQRHKDPANNYPACTLLDVPFECPMRDCNAICKIPKLRVMLGDHVQQHDIQIPEDDTQAQRKANR